MTSLTALADGGLLDVDVELAPLTTYKFGGRARYFLEAHDETSLLGLAGALAETPAPMLVLGRGSNVVVSDRGFPGVVVHLGSGLAGFRLDGDEVEAGAALPLPMLARHTAKAGRCGLEFMVGIPGSVGGAIRMNAGCYGSETGEWLLEARIVDMATAEIVERTPHQLEMAYRHCNLTSTDVVVSARFRTAPGGRDRAEEKIREITRWRREHQPGGTLNAGSVFRNPPGDAAGRIIDELGLKGTRVGGASVSQKHANFFVAEPGATAQDVFDLVSEVRLRVAEATGIALVPEVQFVGEFEERAR